MVEKLSIDEKLVHYYVNELSCDKNPIHLGKRPIIPGDLLSSLYLQKNWNSFYKNKKASLNFKKVIKAPINLEFNCEGLVSDKCYKNNRNSNNYFLKDENGNDLIEISNNYIEKANKMYYLDNFFELEDEIKGKEEVINNFFSIFYNDNLNDEEIKIQSLLAYSTEFLNRNIKNFFEGIKTAIYKGHSFKIQEDGVVNNIFYVNLRAEEIKKDRYQLEFEFVKGKFYVKKVLIVSGKAKEKLKNYFLS